MSGPGQREPSQAGGPAGPEGADAALGEAGHSFTTTDLSLVEMTEIEYTQLQHILYSHMETAAADGELGTRLNSAFLAAAAPGAAAGGFAAARGAPPVYPVLCPPALADGSFAGANQCLGHIDFQELRMMLPSEAGAPPAAEKTPGAVGPGAGTPRPKAPDGAGEENVEGAPETRAKSAVRVRLEDRFNSIPAEPPPAPRGADPPEPGMALNKVLVTHVLSLKLPSIRILDCRGHFLSVISKKLNPLNRLWVVETKLCLSRFGLK
ncbi:LOW QUALITY PROTEIN: transcription factor-like 5 protein [Kogia breviceps]|uniref:LOW QUALITY PROTEIN: transcription factor-like 5 protein n=1 Tax=Kogia breviceps TaxID=27615 RepID=UPI002795F322|nr:LOW QUALITY PROTEIN: transcription factor-like 5 protein [Kogia breviceps]